MSIVSLAAVIATVTIGSIGPRNVVGMILYDQRSEGRLRVGDRAPDVELLALDGGRRLQLSELLGGQVSVLIFGSFT
jgi:hypothetical protein